jgi:hypothetical protein
MTLFSKPSITDWIQAGVVVIALGLAFNELVLSSSLSKREQKAFTAQLFEKRGSEQIMTSYLSYIEYSRAGVPEDVTGLQALADVTPYHEHLISWVVCYEHELCDPKLTRTLACKQIKDYEPNAKIILADIGLEYIPEERHIPGSKLLEDCQNA